jgi:hypothetical protein
MVDSRDKKLVQTVMESIIGITVDGKNKKLIGISSRVLPMIYCYVRRDWQKIIGITPDEY